ncbi:Vegetative incompatibility protein HET-E-1 [Colletotrichum tanaceti]|nr:Vegetative incompatibility protein HET-E-1 [Colletotrichum tanaceti]
MRLLSVKSFQVREFAANAIPPYAILSHRWLGDDEEVVLQDMGLPVVKTKLGYEELTSSAELSESINSMFLSDVPSDSALEEHTPFAKSKCLITGIDELTLRGRRKLHLSSIAARMSWAAKRETTREEDRSYSLLGLFGVHLPLLYGEGGKNAFLRLQEELIRISDDRSISAWHSGSFCPQEEFLPAFSKGSSFLASSPADFSSCSDIVICNLVRKPSNFVITNAGLRIDVPIIFE